MQLLADLKSELAKITPEELAVLILPPFVYLQMASNAIDGTGFWLGAQDLDERENGSVTGAISAKMLQDVGCQYALIGHSERRLMFKESNESIARKLSQCLKEALVPIVCLGESLDQRKAGAAKDVISNQLEYIIGTNSFSDLRNLVIAYEPVWAIGTGKSASIHQIEEVHFTIRDLLGKHDPNLAADTRIIYGGSVTPANAQEILEIDGVDGALIGGASLDATSFGEICQIANKF